VRHARRPPLPPTSHHPHRPSSRRKSGPSNHRPSGCTKTRNGPRPSTANPMAGGYWVPFCNGMTAGGGGAFGAGAPARTKLKSPHSPAIARSRRTVAGEDGCASGVAPGRDRTDRPGATSEDSQLRSQHQPAALARSLTNCGPPAPRPKPRRCRFRFKRRGCRANTGRPHSAGDFGLRTAQACSSRRNMRRSSDPNRRAPWPAR
jgi:hypothetical protein